MTKKVIKKVQRLTEALFLLIFSGRRFAALVAATSHSNNEKGLGEGKKREQRLTLFRWTIKGILDSSD
jgi:hypothetical protein